MSPFGLFICIGAIFLAIQSDRASGFQDVTKGLYISNAFKTDAGEWGSVELCADGSFVSGIEIRYELQGHLDETAINGVKLYCSNSNGDSTGDITSTLGHYGSWRGVSTCATDYITGFRANVLVYQGPLVDDVALENMKVHCNYGSQTMDSLPFDVPNPPNVDTYDFKNGTWSLWSDCDAGTAVCGIQTRHEDASLGDETSVCDLILFCCTR